MPASRESWPLHLPALNRDGNPTHAESIRRKPYYWGREIGRLGHRVSLISPNYVKPYLKRGKSYAHDARAICEAASLPGHAVCPRKERRAASGVDAAYVLAARGERHREPGRAG